MFVENATYKLGTWFADFDPSAIEYIQWEMAMPSDWDGGTFTAQFYWTAAGGSGDVVWGIQIICLGNDDAIDGVDWGTAQEVTDTLTAVGDMDISAVTAAITPAGTPAAGDSIHFRVYRKATDAADTLNSNDARLSKVRVAYSLA